MDVYQRRRLVALGGLAAVVVLLAVAIGQCGGDGDEDAVPVTTIGGVSGPGLASLPKEDFIEQADAICAETDAAIEQINTADATRAARQEAEAAVNELDQLQTLPAPEEDADVFDTFLSALEEQTRALGDKELAAERGDDAALAGIEEEVATAEADAESAAEEFGFQVCGDPEAGGGADTETDTGAATEPAPTEVAPAEPVEPAPAAPVPEVTPEGGATPAAPPADTGGDSESGGVSP
jgi:hypothetical protein